jgi:hypothetical protein
MRNDLAWFDHARGVNVRLVADRLAPCDLQEGVSALPAAGIPIWIDARARVAHEKALIIDRRVTIMGSYSRKQRRSTPKISGSSHRRKSPRPMRGAGARGRQRRSGSATVPNGAGDDDGALLPTLGPGDDIDL